MSMKHLQLRPRQFLTGIIAVSFVAVFSALMLFVTNDPLQRSQDTRKQAAIPEQGTIAEIKITPAAASIEVGKSSSFVISGLTGGSDTYGFQFVGAIDTANIENISITSHPQANLGFPVATVTGSEIVIFATHPNITPAVNISSFQDLATISFTAKKAGTVTITPNQSNSKVIDKTSSVNILKPMSAANIQIAAEDTPPAACTKELKICSDNSTVGRDPNNNCEFKACPTVSDSGTGGYVVNGCNGDCGSNRECSTNLACYNGKCRLATNLASTSCQPATSGGSSTLSSCNQYCADSKECSSSLVCWYNQCRNPLNVESSTCAAASVAQTQAVTVSCNQGCDTNRDCATSLSCYYGVCRAPTNPKSTTCNPVPPTATPAPTKGQNAADLLADTKAATAAAGTASPTPAPTATPAPRFDEPVDQSALGAVQQYLTNFWQTGNRTQVMIVVGLAVLMIIGLIALLVSLLSPRKPKRIVTHKTPPPTMPPPTLTMQR